MLKKSRTPNFYKGNQYSNTLEGTKEKVLISLQAKLMLKFEVRTFKILDSWQKVTIFDNLFKNLSKTFFTYPKPYLISKYWKKLM